MSVFSNFLFFYNFVWNCGDLFVTSRFFFVWIYPRAAQIWTEHSHNESKYIDSSWIYGCLYSKIKIGVAGLIFEPTLLILQINTAFEDVHCSNDVEMIFWFLYCFQIFKDKRVIHSGLELWFREKKSARHMTFTQSWYHI